MTLPLTIHLTIIPPSQTYMEDAGTRIALGVLPVSIAKTDDGRLLVELSNGSKELFDTVVAAVGKYVRAHESPIVISHMFF